MRATDLGIDFDRERIRPLLLPVHQVGICQMYIDVIPLSFFRTRHRKCCRSKNGNPASQSAHDEPLESFPIAERWKR